MAMYDTLLARHGISAGAQGLSASNGPLAGTVLVPFLLLLRSHQQNLSSLCEWHYSEGLDRVVAALREEYMNHLRKSIALCDSEIEYAPSYECCAAFCRVCRVSCARRVRTHV